jgi:hypothetical protein
MKSNLIVKVQFRDLFHFILNYKWFGNFFENWLKFNSHFLFIYTLKK